MDTMPIESILYDMKLNAYLYPHQMESIPDKPGVYIVFVSNAVSGSGINAIRIIDLGEASNIQEQIRNHRHKECWENERSEAPLFSTLHIGVYLEKDSNRRRKIKEELEGFISPPC